MSQLSGPIPDRIAGQGRTQDRRDTTLGTTWLIRAGGGPGAGADPLLRRDAESPVPAAGQPVLVMLSDQVPATAQTAAAAISAGRRVYCLAPDGWASDHAPGWLTGAPATSILVRRVRQAPVAAVLAGSQGWIWAGPDGPGEWRLELDQRQAVAARLAFLDLFWNRSDDEAWPEDGRVQWRDRGEPPFDLPVALAQEAVRLDLQAGPPPEPTSDGVLYSARGELPAHFPRQLWLPPSGSATEQARLAGAVRRQCSVVWTDLGLPTCTTGGRAVLRPSTGRWTLTVQLTPGQAAALTAVLGQPPTAEFGIDVSLAEAARQIGRDGSVWPAGQDQPERLLEEQVLDAGVVPAASLRDMALAEPADWPAPSPLARSVRYTWHVAAPQPPASARPDPLVRSWRAVDDEFAGRVTSALAGLAAAETQADTLGRDFPARKSAAAGFALSVKDLRAGLRGSRDAVPSARGPDGARDLLGQLAELEKKVTALASDLAGTVTRAQAEVDRESQEKEHAARQATARTELADYTDERAAKTKRLADLEARLGELAVSADEEPAHDRTAAQGKIRGEQNKLTGEIRALDRRIAEATVTADQAFTFHPRAAARPGPPGAGRRSRGLPPTAAQPDRIGVPGQALPAVGQLLRAGTERMLAISRWAELDQGEAEAARLSARLVAAREDL